MKILWRSIIVLGFAGPGFFLTMAWAARSGVAEGSGLAGGAIIIAYGLGGALLAAVIGLGVGLRLSETALPRTAGILGIVLVGLVLYTTMAIRARRMALPDPPEAYKGIPVFVLTRERTNIADLVLAKRVSIDSKARRWTTTLPDQRICSAQAPAVPLRKASEALEAFLEASGGEVSCTGAPEEVVSWLIESGTEPKEGSIGLNAACLTSESEAQYLLFTLQQVTLTSEAPVDCSS